MPRTKTKTSKSQLKASKNYKQTEAGKQAQRKSTAKYYTKKFINEYADETDLHEVSDLVKNRLKEISECKE